MITIERVFVTPWHNFVEYLARDATAIAVGNGYDSNSAPHALTRNAIAHAHTEPPPIKESSLDSDYAIRFGNFMGVIFDGEKNAYDGADYRQAASG